MKKEDGLWIGRRLTLIEEPFSIVNCIQSATAAATTATAAFGFHESATLLEFIGMVFHQKR